MQLIHSNKKYAFVTSLVIIDQKQILSLNNHLRKPNK